MVVGEIVPLAAPVTVSSTGVFFSEYSIKFFYFLLSHLSPFNKKLRTGLGANS
jgi:hypothetical protein